MKIRISSTLILTAIFLFGIVVPATAADEAKEKKYLLTTASTGGTFYPVGVALSTLVKVKLEPKHPGRRSEPPP